MLIIIARQNIKIKNNRFLIFSFFICVLNSILIITFFCSNIIWFYVFFETSLIPTLALILGWGYQPERLQAGMYIILYTITASLPLLALILLRVEVAGTGNFMLKEMLISKGGLIVVWRTESAANLVFFIGLAAFLVKLPMFSVHL